MKRWNRAAPAEMAGYRGDAAILQINSVLTLALRHDLTQDETIQIRLD